MKKCFVICPIGDEGSEIRRLADESLEFVIGPACKSKGYEVLRSDKISDNGMITQSIIENILQADLAIADLSGRNPNVFYELAIRHSYGLAVIQITRDELTEIPFDVHNVRTIQYDLSASGANKAKEQIENVIETVEQGNKAFNPVTSVAGILNIESGNQTSDINILSELLLKVNGLPEQLDRLENNIGVRFSQMLTAFGESFKARVSDSSTQGSLQDIMLSKFMETIMNDPQKGLNQMKNLMEAQKYIDAINFDSKDN